MRQLSKMEAQEFHMKPYLGVDLRNPISFSHIHYVPIEWKYTWAQKRRDRLVYRLQLIKSWRNRVFAGILSLIGIFLSLCIVAFLDSHAHSDYNHAMIGILGAELIILSCCVFMVIPTDPYELSVKHKGKILH